MIRYYCSGFDVNNVFGHGLGEMLATELPKTDNMLFIPCGQAGFDKNENRDKGENPRERLDHSFIRQLKDIGIEFKNSHVLNPCLDKDKANQLIQEADFIVMMGGNPLFMDEMLDELNIRESLKNYNGVMLGFSAGAMNMSKYIIITPCSKEYPDFVIREGLNLDNISIYPHNNTNLEEYPDALDVGGEIYKRDDLIKVASEYGDYYLLQDYMKEDSTFDISIIKVSNGNIEYYTENDGKIWLANSNEVKLFVPDLSKRIKR